LKVRERRTRRIAIVQLARDSDSLTLRRYLPQLDGIRAVAISAVVAYHLGYLPGGWIGVDIFFVLSGYLITGLLLEVDRPPGKLANFWGRRAKRLLPAVLLLLVALSVYAWAGGRGIVPAQLRSPGLTTLFYVANWQQIVAGHDYFARYQEVSSLQPTWSLAIEEQYYLLWPLLIVAITTANRIRKHGDPARVLFIATLVLAVASAVWMGVAAHVLGPNRAYLGTDTRAWELLIGGAAAMIWPLGGASSAERQRLWSVLSVLGVIGVVLGVALAGGPPWWIWNGGLVAIASCALLIVVGAVRVPRGLVGRALALPPLRWLGVISYSLYLWHWPVIALMTHDTTGFSGAQLLTARLAAMVALSCASFYFVERPLRRADWGALRRRLHVPALGFVVAGIGLTALVILVGTIGPPQAITAKVAAPHAPPTTVTGRIRLGPLAPGQKYQTWVFGDSVMVDSSPGITAALEATGDVSVAVNSAFPGWGLTVDHSWLSGVKQTLASSRLQIAIGTWSWDDQEALANPAGYRKLLEQYVGALVAPPDGVKLVVLLQFPQGGPNDSIPDPSARELTWRKQTALADAWDGAARQVVAAFPGRAIYLTTAQLFAPKGLFLTWMRTPAGGWVRARKLDNIHMCPYGAAEFGALVTAELTPLLHLGAVQPGWEFASWTKDARYNDPPGACPDDKPPAGYRGVTVPRVKVSSSA
jgi:peptidoglycan/LPS O-acetylase OafA/YrhL